MEKELIKEITETSYRIRHNIFIGNYKASNEYRNLLLDLIKALELIYDTK